MNKNIDTGPIQIEWGAKKGGRARKVISRSKSRTTGKYPSLKMGKMMHWESLLEYEAFILHDADPRVTLFQEQPAKITYFIEGGAYVHFPDLYVEEDGHCIFREIKMEEDANSPEVKGRTAFLEQALPSIGYRYEVWTETHIRNGHRLANAKLLLRLGRDDIKLIERERIRRFFAEAVSVRWGDILKGCLGENGVHRVCRLMLEGFLSAELAVPLTEDSIILLKS